MMKSRVRLRHLKRDPRFALCVMDAEDWYRSASLHLVAEDISADAALADIDALSVRYTGEPYGARNQARVSVRARIVRPSA